MCHVQEINLSQICGLYARWTHLIICWRKAAKRKMNKNLANLAAIDEAQFCFFFFWKLKFWFFLLGQLKNYRADTWIDAVEKKIYSNNHQEQDCAECKVHILFFLRSSFSFAVYMPCFCSFAYFFHRTPKWLWAFLLGFVFFGVRVFSLVPVRIFINIYFNTYGILVSRSKNDFERRI